MTDIDTYRAAGRAEAEAKLTADAEAKAAADRTAAYNEAYTARLAEETPALPVTTPAPVEGTPPAEHETPAPVDIRKLAEQIRNGNTTSDDIRAIARQIKGL